MIIVGGVGCCVCLFAAASGLATGGTKKQKPRASSYKLEAGKRPPPPDSDSDSEKPAAAVSRALEKLDDEEEGPPAYDFTPDKAKPAKHRSSVEVDELWPAAGAGAGDQRVQGAGKRHGLRLGLGPGQPHLSARAHVVRVEPPPHR